MQSTWPFLQSEHTGRRSPWAELRRRLAATHVITGGLNAGKRLAVRRPHPDFLNGTYEAVIQGVIAERLNVGGVFYDVGANIGFFSLLAASRVGPDGAVYAFEPVPANASSIRRSARLNSFSNIAVFEEAVAESSGRANLILTRHIGGAALASGRSPGDLSHDVTGEIEVAVTTLDDAIAARGLRPPTFVKIDVEGAELSVLRGMRDTLARHRPAVLYEIDDATLAGVSRKREAIENVLSEAGYRSAPLPDAYPDIEWQVAHALALPADAAA